MSVVELGNWNVRAGYIGDVVPTQTLRSVWSPLGARERSLPSILRSLSSASEEEELPARLEQPMWTLQSLEHHSDRQLESLQYIQKTLLQCYEEDPLMLVVPEAWHERVDVMQRVSQMVLEGGVAPAVYLCRPSVAWALGQGRTSAVVTDIGHSHISSAAVLDGQTIRHSVESVPVGTAAILAQFEETLKPALQPALASTFGHLSEPARRLLGQDIANTVAEKVGFVVSHSLPLSQAPSTPLYRAPDGTPIALTPEQRSQPYEVLFGRFSVADVISRVKGRLDPEWLVTSVHHLVVGGGSATPGLLPRLVEELKDKDSSYGRYEQDGALQLAKRQDGAWAGASLAASSSSFFPLWITRSEWEEEGSSVLHRKLFY